MRAKQKPAVHARAYRAFPGFSTFYVRGLGRYSSRRQRKCAAVGANRRISHSTEKVCVFLRPAYTYFSTGGCERVHDDRFARGGTGRAEISTP
jgi:hypothetical protein